MKRFSFQLEAFGLSVDQRAAGAAAIGDALESNRVDLLDEPDIREDFDNRGAIELFVSADFAANINPSKVFNAAVDWLDTKATDAPDGRHSYVRMVATDPVKGVRTLYAASPEWAPTDTTVPFTAAHRLPKQR